MKPARFIVALLVAQLLAIPAAPGMLVLCFGSDGHVALEAVGGGDCCRALEEGHGDAVSAREGSIGPSPGPCCEDVDLFIESATLTSPSQKIQEIPSARGLTATPFPCGATFISRAAPSEAEPPTSSSLRTVVLRA